MKESILQKIRRLSLDINEKILPGASFLERIRIMYDFCGRRFGMMWN